MRLGWSGCCRRSLIDWMLNSPEVGSQLLVHWAGCSRTVASVTENHSFSLCSGVRLMGEGNACEALAALLKQQRNPVGLFLRPALCPGASAALESPPQGHSCCCTEQTRKPPAPGATAPLLSSLEHHFLLCLASWFSIVPSRVRGWTKACPGTIAWGDGGGRES